MADLRAGAREGWVQIYAVFGKILTKSYVGAPGGLVPPPRRNPGSTSEQFKSKFKILNYIGSKPKD